MIFFTQYLFNVGYPCSLCERLSYNSDSWDYNPPAVYASSQHPLRKLKLIIIIFRKFKIVFVSCTQYGKY